MNIMWIKNIAIVAAICVIIISILLYSSDKILNNKQVINWDIFVDIWNNEKMLINTYGNKIEGKILIHTIYNPFANVSWKIDRNIFLTVSKGEARINQSLWKKSAFFKLHSNWMYSYYKVKEFLGKVVTLWDIILLDTNFKKKKQFSVKNYSKTDGQDFLILKNGNYMLIAYDTQEIDGEKIEVWILQEQTPAWEVVFEWKSIDYIPVSDAEYTPSIPYYIENNINDYIHINSIFEDIDGNIIISSRNINEVTKIDRKTGDIIWRLWWKQSDFQFIDDPLDWFNHQYNATRIKNGNILIYDNGNLHTPPQTRVVEYKLDEKNKTATLVWSYQEKGKFTYALGWAQRLNNGNTLISWWLDQSTLKVSEVNKKWKKILDIFLPVHRWIYRVYKEE